MTELWESYEWLYGQVGRTNDEPQRAVFVNHRGKLIAEVWNAGYEQFFAYFYVNPFQLLVLKALVSRGQIVEARFLSHLCCAVPTVRIETAQIYVEDILDNADIVYPTYRVWGSPRGEKLMSKTDVGTKQTEKQPRGEDASG